MGNLTCLLYLVDTVSSKRYLVDSGSAYSIIPHRSTAAPTGPRLITAEGTRAPFSKFAEPLGA